MVAGSSSTPHGQGSGVIPLESLSRVLMLSSRFLPCCSASEVFQAVFTIYLLFPLVFQGGGYTIGYGETAYRGESASIRCPLMERGWYHIPPGLTDISPKDGTAFKGRAVTRTEFMLVLGQLESILVRAKYITNQMQGV